MLRRATAREIVGERQCGQVYSAFRGNLALTNGMVA